MTNSAFGHDGNRNGFLHALNEFRIRFPAGKELISSESGFDIRNIARIGYEDDGIRFLVIRGAACAPSPNLNRFKDTPVLNQE